MKIIKEKTENQTYSYGCIMGYFDTPISNIQIEENDIYNNDTNEFGLEIEPHVTILFGLLDDKIPENEIVDLLLMINPPEISSKMVNIFESNEYDVVKYEIEGNNLHILNKIFSTYPNENSYPTYEPHSTIAYVKKGTGKKYIQVLLHEEIKQISYWVYSMANGKKIKIDPKNNLIETIREEYDDSIIVEYLGYDIIIKPHTRLNDAYYFSIYENNIYKMALRGPILYDNGLNVCKNYINNI